MGVAWNLGIPWQGTGTEDLAPLGFRRRIELATINGARALGLEAVTGPPTPGERADLILIDAGDLNDAPVADLESTWCARPHRPTSTRRARGGSGPAPEGAWPQQPEG